MFGERAAGHVEKRAEQERAIAPPVPNTVQNHSREGYNLAALLLFYRLFGQPVATYGSTGMERALAMRGVIRGRCLGC